jgi:hypothetical protein
MYCTVPNLIGPVELMDIRSYLVVGSAAGGQYMYVFFAQRRTVNNTIKEFYNTAPKY